MAPALFFRPNVRNKITRTINKIIIPQIIFFLDQNFFVKIFSISRVCHCEERSDEANQSKITNSGLPRSPAGSLAMTVKLNNIFFCAVKPFFELAVLAVFG